MILKNHIAYRFLTDKSLDWEIVQTMYPESYKAFLEYGKTLKNDERFSIDDFPKEHHKIGTLLIFLQHRGNKNYYITETVTDKLNMLKVKRKDNGFFDWSVFGSMANCKKTFIFPDNTLLRLNIEGPVIHFMHMSFKFDKGKNNEGHMNWELFFADRRTGVQHSEHNLDKVSLIDERIFKILCFIFLTENDEVIVPPGQRHGTKKEGKIINSLNVPVTIVNSRWNTTVIRNEGFGVSGHFRVQPFGPQMSQHKIIFIDPFTKTGYIRKAQST